MSSSSCSPRDMIERLVGFDTTSRNSNLALIDWVADYLAAQGIASRRTTDEGGGKANLFATIGPERAGGLVLSGHTDVVPVDGQDWTSDPWRVIERDGRLYGRGTADMKSFIAIALALVPEMRARPLACPIHLALSYDEELGCLGVGRLIEDVVANLPRPRIVIVGEPTDLKPVNAHKGVQSFETRVTGRAAHSSQPHRGASAIFAAARLIAFLHRLAEEKRAEAAADSPFEPPYTTFQIGTIAGGTALNIIPQECRFVWEFRTVPGDDPAAIERRVADFVEAELLPELRANAPEAEIVTRRRTVVPALTPEPDGPAEALVRRLTGANRTGVVAFGTEGGLFQQAGMSTVVCGPGSIDQAHQPDEFITLAQVEAGTAFLRRVIDWAGAASH